MRLNQRQHQLLNTDFGSDMEKRAHEIVGMEKVASECMSYGYDLAMQKIAELEEKASKSEEEQEEEKEEEKTASAMGQIIMDAYWDTLLTKGAEFYGNSDIYIDKIAEGAPAAAAPGLWEKLKGKTVGQLGTHAKDVVNPKNYMGHLREAIAPGDIFSKARAGAIGKAAVLPGLALGGAYAGKKIYDKMKSKKEDR